MHISRRVFLGAIAASAATAAGPVFANAPTASLRPWPRPDGLRKSAVRSAEDLIASAELGGQVGFAVSDAVTGEVLEVRNPVLSLPPASVTKSVTALYALDALGESHRFKTRLIATGPVTGGTVAGDLVLVGGGDPALDTDALAGMAQKLRAAGIRSVAGRFVVDDTALPNLFSIDPGQPDHVAYNPAISGLNLNYNRVYFEWRRKDGGYSISLDARAEKYRPEVDIARMRVVERELPVYTYADAGGSDQWTVARPALGSGGGRWLPVRKPSLYAGEVFRTLAAAQGISLPRPRVATAPVRGADLVIHESPELRVILRDMLRWSTNLTAEIVGMSASAARGVKITSLAQSAAEMNAWAHSHIGARRARFVDHSGLGDGSRVPASDLVRALTKMGPHGPLRRIMKKIPMRNAKGEVIENHPITVQAKTGTLNFVSALAGYMTTGGGRELTFAILTADVPRREALSRDERERPDGARSWTRRSRRMQLQLIERWGTLYDS